MQAQDSTDPTGVATDGKVGATIVRARERKSNAALQMKLAGADWQEIAEVIGYPTARQAIVAVEQALERELHQPENQEAMRNFTGKRLERLLRAVWGKAVNPDSPEQMAAVGRSRELIADFRKLHGLDAPTEMVVRTPTQVELEKWVNGISNASKVQVAEYDIIAGEVMEAFEEVEDAVPTERAQGEDPVHDVG